MRKEFSILVAKVLNTFAAELPSRAVPTDTYYTVFICDFYAEEMMREPPLYARYAADLFSKLLVSGDEL